MLPCLVFDDKHGYMTRRVVDHVLLLHRGRIETFELSIRKYPAPNYIAYGNIDKWIAHLSRHSIKEFILKLWKQWSPYDIFSRLFSYQDLTHLELHNCLLARSPIDIQRLRDVEEPSSSKSCCVPICVGKTDCLLSSAQ